MEFTARAAAVLDSDYEDLVHEYVAAKAAADRASAHLKVCEQRLLGYMEMHHLKSVVDEDEDLTRRITYVSREVLSIDEKGLRRALRAKVYDRYTVRKLDRKALEGAMERGEVDPMIVSKFVEVGHSAPYLRYSEGIK